MAKMNLNEKKKQINESLMNSKPSQPIQPKVVEEPKFAPV